MTNHIVQIGGDLSQNLDLNICEDSSSVATVGASETHAQTLRSYMMIISRLISYFLLNAVAKNKIIVI